MVVRIQKPPSVDFVSDNYPLGDFFLAAGPADSKGNIDIKQVKTQFVLTVNPAPNNQNISVGFKNDVVTFSFSAADSTKSVTSQPLRMPFPLSPELFNISQEGVTYVSLVTSFSVKDTDTKETDHF